MKKIFLQVFAIVALSSCLKQEPLKLKNTGFSPIKSDDGWEVSTLKAEKIDSNLIINAFDYFFSHDQLPMSKSLIVIRNGKIVAEAYSKNKNDIYQIDNIQSCTKSILSLLVGIAFEKKLITDVNSPLFHYFPEHFDKDVNKRRITLKHCLTMKTGLSFSGGDDSEELANIKENSLKFILKAPLISEPGTSFLYSDFSAHLVSGVLNKVTGKSVEQFARENLFQPLGITNYEWEKGNDNLNFGAFSLYLRPRDLGKLGQLCLQKGVWKNQVLFSNWIEQAAVEQANSSYGYFFWLNPSQHSYSMQGNGRQMVIISPLKKLIIVHTAFPYTSIPLWGNLNPVINSIYNACK